MTRTPVREVHRVCGAHLHAGYEPLVDKLVNVVERLEDDVGRKVNLTRIVHDQDRAALAIFKHPLALEGRGGDTGSVPVGINATRVGMCSVTLQAETHIAMGRKRVRTLRRPRSSPDVWRRARK